MRGKLVALLAWMGIAVFIVVAGIRAASLEQYLPDGFPAPLIPDDNLPTEARVELGRHLFFDVRLSADGTFSCATCHQPAHAFTDRRPRAIGVTGEVHPRGSMSLANVAYNTSLNWADPTLKRLEEQMVIPMFSVSPVEMGLSGREEEVLLRILQEPAYPPLFEAAFAGEPEPITVDNIILAIASFERTLISGASPYDRYVYWDEKETFSQSAQRGMTLFFSDRLRCSACHSGFNLSGPVAYQGSPPPQEVFHNTALFNLDGKGAYPDDDPGLLTHTRDPRDMGKFRAPTLRNIALTAPYMHGGSLATLEAVIDHYARGGRAAGSPLKSELLAGFEISAAEIEDLVAFLESLTDETFIHDPRFQSPWVTR